MLYALPTGWEEFSTELLNAKLDEIAALAAKLDIDAAGSDDGPSGLEVAESLADAREAVQGVIDTRTAEAADATERREAALARLAPAPEPEVEETAAAKPAPAPAPEPKVSPQAKAPPAKKAGDEFPAPLPPKKKTPVVVPKLKDGSRDAVKEAIGYLTREGRALAKAVDSAETVPVTKVMARSVDNVQWLADHLQDNGESDDPVLERARNTAIDAADLIQLMQLEKQESAVLDAVSLVLQLKHELEADLAA